MRGAEAVVFALGAFGETRQAAALAQRPDAVAPAGQNLVRIGLMPDVPDQPVVRGVEYIAQCNGKLDQIGRAHAELQSRLHLVCRLLLEKKNTHIMYRPPRFLPTPG